MSPERFKGDSKSLKEDLWALGVITFQMSEMQFPFKGRPHEIEKNVTIIEHPKLLERSTELQKLVD